MSEALLPILQRWLLFSGVLLLVGVVAWRSFVGPWQPRALRKAMGEMELRLARAGVLFSLLLVPIWGMRLWVQMMEFRDPFAPLAEDLGFLLFETFWGPVWMAQGGVLILLAVTFHLVARRVRHRRDEEKRAQQSGEPREGGEGPATRLPLGWKAAWCGALLLVLTLSLSSHALSVPVVAPLAVGLDALHTVAAGAWIGTLALILRFRPQGPEATPVLAGQLQSFSYLALGAVPLLLIMGIMLSGLHLGEFRNLWASGYGRVLSLKVLAAAGVLYLGFHNWRYGLPDLEGEDGAGGEGARKVRTRAALEVGVAALVVLFTAILVGTSMPEGVH
jgi:putative copper export protein